MVVLIDANVVIDYTMSRESGLENANQIMLMCAKGEVTGYIAFHSVSVVWYVMRKIPDEERRRLIKQVLGFVTVIGTSHEDVITAIDRDAFKDFEDCLQDMCASSIGAQYIVTSNVKDFAESQAMCNF